MRAQFAPIKAAAQFQRGDAGSPWPLDPHAPAPEGDAADEIAQLRQRAETAEPAWYECPDCGFRYDAAHTDVDGGYSCPACGEERAASHNVLLRGDLATAERERDGALESLREMHAQKEHWFNAALAAEAQVRRLRHAARDLDLLAETARWLTEERDRLRAAGALLRDVARECTVEFEDSRLDYVVVQCDRHLWDAVQRAAPAEGAA